MKRSGFTLVELSIVLVIIGLLIGGVLKGKSMIENAKLKRVKADADGIVAATYGYQDKYGYLPGDDPQDRSTELGATSCTGGDGDGLFDSAEYACAWQELIGAGFMSGDASEHTENLVAKNSPYGGNYMFRYGTRGNRNGNYIQVENVPSDKIKSLDEKYDDGVWNTGDLQANQDYPATPTNRTMYWYAF